MEKDCRECRHNDRNSGTCKFSSIYKDCSCFSKWQPIKEKIMKEYELCEKYKDGFSLIDIAKKHPCWDEFVKLLKEGHVNVRNVYKWENWTNAHTTIRNNTNWFAENGFIQEKQKELKPCLVCKGKVVIKSDGYGEDKIICAASEGGCGLTFFINPCNEGRQDRIYMWNKRD